MDDKLFNVAQLLHNTSRLYQWIVRSFLHRAIESAEVRFKIDSKHKTEGPLGKGSLFLFTEFAKAYRSNH